MSEVHEILDSLRQSWRDLTETLLEIARPATPARIPQCDCEHSGHKNAHKVGGCTTRPTYRVKNYGMAQNLCSQCLLFTLAGENQVTAWKYMYEIDWRPVR